MDNDLAGDAVEPELVAFLNFLLEDALAHPELLGDVDELLADDGDLFDEVDAE